MTLAAEEMQGQRTRGKADRRVAIAILAFAATVYAYTFTFDEVPAALMSGLGAELFPRLVLGLIALLAALLFLHVGSPAMDDPGPVPGATWRIALALIGVIGLLLLMGMWPACFAAVLGLGLLWGERSWTKLTLSAAIHVAALYLLFVHLLGGSFPRGLLGEFFGH